MEAGAQTLITLQGITGILRHHPPLEVCRNTMLGVIVAVVVVVAMIIGVISRLIIMKVKRKVRTMPEAEPRMVYVPGRSL